MQTLSLVERERITDSMLKIQSVRHSLDSVGDDKIPGRDEIETCLDNADQSLRAALGYAPSHSPTEKDLGKP
jgi:hypothetical protein